MQIPVQEYLNIRNTTRAKNLVRLAKNIHTELRLKAVNPDGLNGLEVFENENKLANMSVESLPFSLSDNQGYDTILNLIQNGKSDMKSINHDLVQFLDSLTSLQANSNPINENQELSLLSHFDRKISMSILDDIYGKVKHLNKDLNYPKLALPEQQKHSENLVKEIVEEHQIDAESAIAIIQEFGFEFKEEYNPQKIFTTLQDLYKDLKLEDNLQELFYALGQSTLAQGVKSFTNSNQEKGLDEDGNMKILDTFISNTMMSVSRHIQMDSRKNMDLIMSNLRTNLDSANTEAAYWGDLVFLDKDIDLDQARNILDQGAEASINLLKELLNDSVPGITRVAFDTANVFGIHPVLALINTATVASQIVISQLGSNDQQNLQNSQLAIAARIQEALKGIGEAYDEILTSPELDQVLAKVDDLNDENSKIDKEIIESRGTNALLAELPFQAGFLGTLITGELLQKTGMVSGKKIHSFIMSSLVAQAETANLIQTVTQKYPAYINQIEKRNNLLKHMGMWETSQRELDKLRVPYSSVEDMTLKIESLCDAKGILQNIDLEIPPGTLLSIIGPSGAGKSTLLKTILGLNNAKNGSIKLGNTDIRTIRKFGPESLKQIVLYSTQSPNVMQSESLRNNLKQGTNNEYSDEDIKAVFRDLNLSKFDSSLDEKIPNFSGGERVRYGLAKVLLRRKHSDAPMIIVLDEPTASLDRGSRVQVMDILKNIRKSHPETTIIAVTHDADLVDMSKAESEQGTGMVIDIEDINDKVI